MSTNVITSLVGALIVHLSLLPTVSAQAFLGPADLVASEDGNTLYITETQSKHVRALPADFSGPGKTLEMPAEPNAVEPGAEPGKIYVACGVADGIIAEVDMNAGKVLRTLEVGHTPDALELSPDKTYLAVANRFDNEIAIIDLAGWTVQTKIPVIREPADLTFAAGKIWVANLLPRGRADTGDISSEVTAIDPANPGEPTHIKLPNGSTAIEGITGSPDDKYVYATHILARYQVPTTQLDRGWMNTNAVTVINTESGKVINTVLLDEPHLGAANPGEIEVSEDGSLLAVAIEGTHEVMTIDRVALHERLEAAEKGESQSPAVDGPEDVPMDLAFLSGIRERHRLPGRRPLGLELINDRIYATLYYNDLLASFTKDEPENLKSLVFNENPQFTEVMLGEAAFHDATYCFQSWQSCASCHPSEARVDALNWDLLNDGIGNPKQTKSMLLSHQTPPVMVSGVRGDATVAVRAGIRHIFFREPDEELAGLMDVYLADLKPVPSPELVDGALSEAAQRGQKIYNEAGCAMCHSGELHTNLQSYDVGTGGIRGGDEPLDTPTLVEVWRTAPYLKDGRAATIEEIFTKHNPNDQHGRTSDLSPEQIADLSAYVRSL